MYSLGSTKCIVIYFPSAFPLTGRFSLLTIAIRPTLHLLPFMLWSVVFFSLKERTNIAVLLLNLPDVFSCLWWRRSHQPCVCSRPPACNVCVMQSPHCLLDKASALAFWSHTTAVSPSIWRLVLVDFLIVEARVVQHGLSWWRILAHTSTV